MFHTLRGYHGAASVLNWFRVRGGGIVALLLSLLEWVAVALGQPPCSVVDGDPWDPADTCDELWIRYIHRICFRDYLPTFYPECCVELRFSYRCACSKNPPGFPDIYINGVELYGCWQLQEDILSGSIAMSRVMDSIVTALLRAIARDRVPGFPPDTICLRDDPDCLNPYVVVRVLKGACVAVVEVYRDSLSPELPTKKDQVWQLSHSHSDTLRSGTIIRCTDWCCRELWQVCVWYNHPSTPHDTTIWKWRVWKLAGDSGQVCAITLSGDTCYFACSPGADGFGPPALRRGTGEWGKQGRVEVYSLIGQRIAQWEGSVQRWRTWVEQLSLGKGLYFVRLQTERGVELIPVWR